MRILLGGSCYKDLVMRILVGGSCYGGSWFVRILFVRILFVGGSWL